MSWRPATVASVRPESPAARTLVLEVPGWPGHQAGQHVDVRLTADDGYTASRSYSIASVADGELVEVTVERLDDGEVSPYLVDVVAPGDRLEVRGPVGGWFVWRPEQVEPVLLVGGGSGVVPLMAIVRRHVGSGSSAPLRLVYSLRDPAATLYRDELAAPCGRRAVADLRLHPPYAGGLAPSGRPARRGAARGVGVPAERVADVVRVRPDRLRRDGGRPAGRGRARPAPRAHRTLRTQWRQLMTEPTFLDGNAMAGALGEVFAVDVTAAVGRCDGCGAVAVLAESHVFMDAPGAVVRCAGCDSVLMRVVSAPGRTWLDLRGLSYLQLATPATPESARPNNLPR